VGTALLQIVDVRAALAFVADLAECGDGDQLTLLVGSLAALIGADTALVTGCRAWGGDLSVEAADVEAQPLGDFACSGKSVLPIDFAHG